MDLDKRLYIGAGANVGQRIYTGKSPSEDTGRHDVTNNLSTIGKGKVAVGLHGLCLFLGNGDNTGCVRHSGKEVNTSGKSVHTDTLASGNALAVLVRVVDYHYLAQVNHGVGGKFGIYLIYIIRHAVVVVMYLVRFGVFRNVEVLQEGTEELVGLVVVCIGTGVGRTGV